MNKITFNDTVTIKTKQLLLNHSTAIDSNKNEGYDGMLGIATFEGFWCELSFSTNEIVLYKEKPSHYTNYVPVKTRPERGFKVIYVPVTIDNREIDCMIDTGMNRGIFFPDGIAAFYGPEALREIIADEEIPNYHLVKTGSIHIMDEMYTDMFIMTNSYAVNRTSEPLPNDVGLIGLQYLQYYDLLLDLREIRKGESTVMYYKPNTPLEARDYGFFCFMQKVPELGILNFSVHNHGIYIISVIKDSMAYEVYGLEPGVTITTINGRSFKDFSPEELLDPLFYQNVNNFAFTKDGTEYFKEVTSTRFPK